MSMEINIGENKINLNEKTLGRVKVLEIPITITVCEDSFLHIGASPSPLNEKKTPVFKINGRPAIPASSFKGALRHELELLFIEKIDEFAKIFNIENKLLKPCIPTPNPTKAEQELLWAYRGKMDGKKYIGHCEVKVEEDKIYAGNLGICPVCYFMGATGIMGFLRIGNFCMENEGGVIDQTNIRIDRKTGTAAKGAKVEGEHVGPGSIFKGNIEIIISTPILEMQSIQFGDARKINNVVIDKWLEKWREGDKDKRAKFLIEEVLIPAIQNIKILGGQKSKGAGSVVVSVY
ncbi:RAMP superfamily CRISPR-associated protein [Methanothermococcus sp. Ax23]|uniref:RAMP superfamily CRISPR-associated protein n=1 Tax=Methanothermococcus sp. Ax23 TaxID=3156486 RepID=UPI003BA376CE